MKLRAHMSVTGDRLDYCFDTVSGVHSVVFAMTGVRYSGSAGEVANALAPYRNYRDVNELFSWMVQ